MVWPSWRSACGCCNETADVQGMAQAIQAPRTRFEGVRGGVNPDVITIVSGLPRSGTSMMMKVQEAGGMQVLTDDLRAADTDNPKGYYEFEKVKQLDHDQSWLEDAKGKAVKIVSDLLRYLSRDCTYRVIFMERRMEEILASQRLMLIRRGEPSDALSDDTMATIFSKHLQQVKVWLREQPNLNVLYVNYNEILERPIEQVRRINQFLDGSLNPARMVSVVDPVLHRQRR